jgi:hypothetical protein
MDATGSRPMVSIGVPIFGTWPTRLGGAAKNDQESNDNATKELCNVMQSEELLFIYLSSLREHHIGPPNCDFNYST